MNNNTGNNKYEIQPSTTKETFRTASQRVLNQINQFNTHEFHLLSPRKFVQLDYTRQDVTSSNDENKQHYNDVNIDCRSKNQYMFDKKRFVDLNERSPITSWQK